MQDSVQIYNFICRIKWMMDKKEVKRPVFEFGKFTIVEKIEARDESTNTGLIDQPIQSKQSKPLLRNSRLRISYISNPKVIFNYVTPPGDLIEHPQLLPQFKEKLRGRSLDSRLNGSQSKNQSRQNVEEGILSSIHKGLIKGLWSEQKMSDSHINVRSKSLFAKDIVQQVNGDNNNGASVFVHSHQASDKAEAPSTPKRRLSNLSQYSRSSSKRTGMNPEDEISRLVAEKLKA